MTGKFFFVARTGDGEVYKRKRKRRLRDDGVAGHDCC